MYLYSTPAIACALIAAALGWRWAAPLISQRPFVLGVSCLGVVGCLLIALAPLWGDDLSFIAGGVLTGLGTSVLALKTGSIYGTLGRHEVLTAGSMALVFAGFLYFMGTGLPALWQPFFIAALPLVSALLFAMPSDDPFPADHTALHQPGLHTPGMRSYVRLVAASALVAATASFGRGMAATSLSNDAYVESGAIITFIICAASVAICIMVNSVMFTCIMAYMAFRFGFSPVKAFGFGQAAYLASSAAAWGAGMAWAPLLKSTGAAMVTATILVLIIVAVFAFVFTDADIKFIFTWHRTSTPETAEAPALSPITGESPLEQRIAAIPARFGVSAREAQIMLLFAQGHSANWIAEDLVISKNTVRSHIRSIYTKLDVHSRRELLDFLATVKV